MIVQKSHKIYALVLAVLFGLVSNLLQAQEYYVRKIKNTPSNEIYQIFEDKMGYIWLGTNEGLYRFDGKNYIEFLSTSYTNSVSGIQQDKEGRIWCSNFSGQIFYVSDGKLKLFHDYADYYMRFPTFTVSRFPYILTSGRTSKVNILANHFYNSDIA